MNENNDFIQKLMREEFMQPDTSGFPQVASFLFEFYTDMNGAGFTKSQAFDLTKTYLTITLQVLGVMNRGDKKNED